MTFKQFTISFIILVSLTVISVIVGGFVDHTTDIYQGYVIWLVLGAAIYKGHQITDVFMELKTAPLHWRVLLTSYVIVVPTLIGLIYWLPIL